MAYQRRFHGSRLTALLITLVVLLAACGDASGGGASANAGSGSDTSADNGSTGGSDDTAGPGITDDVIKIGASFPMSGSSAAYFGPQADSVEAWVEYVNEEYGGVELSDGSFRRIELIIRDDGFNPERSVQNARSLVESDGVFAIIGVPGTANAAAVASYTEDAGVPLLFVQSASAQWGDTETYRQTVPIQPRSDLEGRGWVHWLAANHSGAKIALLRDDTDFGRGLEQGIREAIDDVDGAVSLVEVQSYQPTDNTLSAQITNLENSGANVLFNGAVQTFAPLAFKAIDASGWDPEIHILTNASSDVASAVAPAGVENFQGLMTTIWLKDPASPEFADDPHVNAWLEAIGRYSPNVEPTVVNMFATMPIEALRAAMLRSPEATRQHVVETARSMSVELGGFAPGVLFDNDPASNEPISTLAIGELEGEYFRPTGDLLETP